MSQGMPQRRSAYRIVVGIEAHYIPVSPTSTVPLSRLRSSAPWVRGKIHDISVGGLRLTGPMGLKSDEHVAVSFVPSSHFLNDMLVTREHHVFSPLGLRKQRIVYREADFPEIVVKGRICHSTYDADHKYFRYHIQFIQLDKRIEEEIARFVNLAQRHALRKKAESD